MLLPLLIVLAIALALPAILSLETGPLGDDARKEATGQFVTLSQGTTHYLLQGPETGATVVMVHGFAVPHYTWTRNAEPVASQGYRVLTFDLFGRGYSDRPDLPYDRATFVSQLHELLMALDLSTPVHLVGVSMGGGIVAAYAADHPNRVTSVTLLAPFNQPVEIGPIAWPLLGDYLARVAYLPTLAEQQLGDFVEQENRDYWIERFHQQMRYDGFEDAIIATAQHFLQQDPGPDIQALARHEKPTLLIWGEQDSVFPFNQAPLVLSELGEGTRFLPLANTGHALHYQRAEEVNLAMLTFWAELADQLP